MEADMSVLGTQDLPTCSSEPKTNYTHAPLDNSNNQIRVLTLLPAAKFEDEVWCHLRIVDAPDAIEGTYGEYKALSYVWGNPALTHQVRIDGQVLQITTALDTALRYLRHKDRIQVLWIDGICINQADDEEKSQQVRILRRIFSSAKKVLIWLGPGDEDTDYVMRQFEASQAKHDKDGTESAKSVAEAYWDDFGNPFALYAKLEHLFARPWWSRVWTMAELLVARKYPLVGCGKYWVSHLLLVHKPQAPDRSIQASRLTSLLKPTSRQVDALLLEDLLGESIQCKATDPRDHVFAITGLLPKHMHPWILPDYSVTVKTLYQRTTYILMQAFLTARLTAQGDRFARGSTRLALPTWCIDFSRTIESEPYTLEYDGLSGEYAAASGSLKPFDMEHDFEWGFILLDGVTVDAIDHVSRIPSVSDSARTYLHSFLHNADSDEAFLEQASSNFKTALRDWIRSFLLYRGRAMHRLQQRVGKAEAHSIFASGQFWKALAGGQTVTDMAYPFYRDFGVRARREQAELASSDLEAARRAGFGALYAEDIFLNDRLDWAEFERRFTRALDGGSGKKRKLSPPTQCLDGLDDYACEALALLAIRLESCVPFVTREGYFGQAAGQAQAGDQLVILSRLMHPVVLRAQEDGLWTFVSFAYVQGIMSGEFVKDEGRLERRMFKLR